MAALGISAATLAPAAITLGAAATSAAACPDPGDTNAAVDGFPERMSSLVGADIRTGRHECFERVVLELAGTGELPGYSVGYAADPIRLDPSDQIVDIAGAATLVLRFGSWMPTPEGDGYSGPTDITPTNVSNILQLRQIENFEGQAAWAIGLDRERPFHVSTLVDPVRIVIDIATDAAVGGGGSDSGGLPATK